MARHVQTNHPSIAEMATERSFEWNGKRQRNTNLLLDQIAGAKGLKTGRLGACFNLIFCYSDHGRERLAIVLGAKSRAERDDTVRSLIQSGN